jgi:glycine dehydrogenase subunit 1
LLLSISETIAGEHGFGIALFEQTSYGSREHGNDWTGNSVYLWAVANAAYLSLMGPDGFAEVGRLILARSHYAARRLGGIDGVRVVFPEGFFKEFVVDFAGTGKTVVEINRALRERGIFGGQDLSQAFHHFGQAALYCVTEIHTQADLDRLASAVAEVVA